MAKLIFEATERFYLTPRDHYADKTNQYVTGLRELYPHWGGLDWRVDASLDPTDRVLDVHVVVQEPPRIPTEIKWAFFKLFVLAMVLIFICVQLFT